MRRSRIEGLSASNGFNSRTPGGVRLSAFSTVKADTKFQFTHPGRGATRLETEVLELRVVSIHAPREGCDFSPGFISRHIQGFNSRTPGGVRLYLSSSSLYLTSFNSRTPGGVRLPIGRAEHLALRVSIHAPREGCDADCTTLHFIVVRFNSRTPGGVRQDIQGDIATQGSFNSRTPGGVRPRKTGSALHKSLFQFTHPGRGATGLFTSCLCS